MLAHKPTKIKSTKPMIVKERTQSLIGLHSFCIISYFSVCVFPFSLHELKFPRRYWNNTGLNFVSWFVSIDEKIYLLLWEGEKRFKGERLRVIFTVLALKRPVIDRNKTPHQFNVYRVFY